MKLVLRLVAIVAILAVLVALGPMIFPLLVVGALALLAYGFGKASRWGWR